MHSSDIIIAIQRKFQEFKGLLTSEISLNLNTSDLKFNIPIIKEPNFVDIIQKFLKFFGKNKTLHKKAPSIHSRLEPNKLKSKLFTKKNYYSLTVSRKSSSRASRDMRNEEEFYEAFDDLEDLLINQHDSLNNSNIINESHLQESLKRKNANKAHKILNYLKDQEVSFVQLQNIIDFKLEIAVPSLSFQVFFEKSK